MSKDSDFDEYLDLFTYWDDLPILEESSSETFQLVDTHEYRKAILQVLRTGIYDERFDKQRHALSMKEISKKVASLLDRKTIPKSTLYHHRDILMENDIIKEVKTILEGKRYTTYYGRTARGFINDHLNSDKIDAQREYFSNILQILNPDEKEDKINQFVQNHLDMKIRHFRKVKEWMEDHSELLKENDIDVITLYDLILDNIPLTDKEKSLERKLQKYLDLIN